MVANLKVLMHVFASLADIDGSDDEETKSSAVERMMASPSSAYLRPRRASPLLLSFLS